ncbi:MAG: HhoA/HhoB/HtrA family serine endopeptidase [Leptolyngbyaceae bacterium]|nr:HhoA/HhoB/HtrA family serine endopeptidase [Leptolyngbyaceae bacterium]
MPLVCMLLGAGLVSGGHYLATNPLPGSEMAIAQPSTPTVSPALPGAATGSPNQPNDRLGLSPSANPTNFVSDVVKWTGGAVVRIDASRTVATSRPKGNHRFDDPALRQYFGNQVPVPPSTQIQEGVGSGFILDSQGHILTNAHVVDGADQVMVTLTDSRTVAGEVLGTDPVTDVAVIKIAAEDLPTVKLGNSDSLEPGQWAIAIGNPLGLDNTVTVGIVSATGRSSGEVGIPEKRVSFIQTDTAINPGNSGGPLLNANGEVIGVNTAIIQDAQSIGFAIPINLAKKIADQLIATGTADHPYIGIQMTQLTPDFQAQLNRDPSSKLTIKSDRGLFVVQVVPDSPADRAGLRAGDVITQVGDQPVETIEAIQQWLELQSVGRSVSLTIERDQTSMQLDVTLDQLPVS